MQEGALPAASLSPMPITIYILWAEWTTGTGGRKDASLFKTEERGQNKFQFCRRKVM